MSHTPGPWTLETVGTSCGICHKIGPFPWRKDQQNHACVYVDYPSHDGSAPRDQELLANARLIAAAPDLLESLEEFCGGLFRYPPGSIGDEVLQKAKAAIAKATGAPNAE